MAWTPISAYILDQVFGYQTANLLRANAIALASRTALYGLGGSRITALPQVASAQDAVDWRDVEIDSTNLAGFTARLRVECRVMNAATSVTPKLRNVTDSTDAGTGAACSATNSDYSGTNQKQIVAVTLAAGVKKYRLMGTPNNTTHPTFVIGDAELYATA